MRKYALFFLAFTTLTGCAARSDMLRAQQDIDDLRNRLLRAEKSIMTVTAEAKEITEQGSREALKNLDTLRKGTADMQANLDAMRMDVQVMTGRVEDLVIAAKKPFEDISLLKEDTSRTVLSMEERLKKLEAAVAENNSRLTAFAKAIEAPQNAENAYKAALDTLRIGEVGKGRELFLKFAEQNPGHKLIPNVRYWIGESYYLEKNYEQAILEFQKVIKDFPGKDKVPAALLKQAMSFRELGDNKSARYLLKELIEKHPSSEEVPTAKEVLGKLK